MLANSKDRHQSEAVLVTSEKPGRIFKNSRTRKLKKNQQSHAEFRIAPFLGTRVLEFFNP